MSIVFLSVFTSYTIVHQKAITCKLLFLGTETVFLDYKLAQ